MIVVFRGLVNGVALTLSTCAPNVDSVTDHLHFTIEFKTHMWCEHFEGKVFVFQGDTLHSITERAMEVYADQWMRSASEGRSMENDYYVTSYQLQ